MDSKAFAKEIHQAHLVALIKAVGVQNINYKEVAKQSAIVTLSYLVDVKSTNTTFGDEVMQHLKQL
jgi:hypothetical protein